MRYPPIKNYIKAMINTSYSIFKVFARISVKYKKIRKKRVLDSDISTRK